MSYQRNQSIARTVPSSQTPSRRSLELTVDYPKPTTTEPRCRVKLVLGSGPCLNQEFVDLLRRRLRLAALVTATGLGIFLLRGLFEPDNPFITSGVLLFQASVTIVIAVIAALLWSRWPLCLRSLRCLEVVLFGLAGAFFLWLQYYQMTSPAIHALLGKDPNGQVTRMLNTGPALRWFVLIVIYGTFIPMTWRRCAVMVGFLTFGPMLTYVVVSLSLPAATPPSWQGLLDLGVILGIGAFVAIFGSYKISTLQEQAYEARRLGQYRLKEQLGAGGMGEVYLAEHVLLRRPCAIKIIRSDQAGDATNLRRFEREVRETARLTHWNTVEIFDYGNTADGTFYYVMEYLPGLSLQELVDRHGPLPPERAVHLLRQVCQGLREAHGIGLIHRDIKPSNILACERGGIQDVAKLLDFGLVRNVGLVQDDARLTQEGVVSGSPLFLSPEQARGRTNLDVRSDIYSLGAVAYFLLTGQPPFDRDSALEALMAHIYETVQFRPESVANIQADLREIVMQCLEKDPAHRFQSVTALDTALAQCSVAGRWSEAQAAAWWQEHAQGESVPPPQSKASEKLLVTAPI